MNNRRIIFLINKLKGGKEKYFNEFYELTKIGVFFTIKKIVLANDIAEEVMQETYISFLKNMHKIDDGKNPYSYLLQMAKNKAIDEYRKLVKIDFEDFVEETTISNQSQVFLFDCPLLEYSKGHLTKEEWEILELTVIMGYKRVEVAKMLNQPISTINWKYNKILKKVSQFYKEVY